MGPLKHESIKDHELAGIGEQCGTLALRCSETAGFVTRVSHSIEADHARLAELNRSVDQLALLQSESNLTIEQIRDLAGRATQLVGESHRSISAALGEITGLIDNVVRLGEEVAGFADDIERVATISGNLQTISRQTSMLAINAAIEAARSGHEASGFAAVASEVKRLAQHARDATRQVSADINRLEERARIVIEDLRAGASRGRAARDQARGISESLTAIAALITQFDQSTLAIERSGELVTAHVDMLACGHDSFAAAIAENLVQLGEARQRLDGLETAANRMFNQIGHSGIETPDSRFVRLACAGAQDVRSLVEAALADRRLTRAALFDTAYQAIPDTDPVQFMNGFTEFADREVRPLLDRETGRDARIVGCCLIDRNGYLPTHISARSAPQRAGERTWNLEHARNRQIFMDGQTRDALDSAGEWFLFTYRQDLGDGRYRALRSVFVPLVFGGERWGLYEVGYLI